MVYSQVLGVPSVTPWSNAVCVASRLKNSGSVHMFRISLVTTLLGLVPLVAAAQEESDSGALTEVVVTAQRRLQNLQEVPISVTAFTGEQLARANVSGAT